jgi:hypothetical protein
LAAAAADFLLSFAYCLDGRRLKVLFVVIKCVKLIIFIIILLLVVIMARKARVAIGFIFGLIAIAGGIWQAGIIIRGMDDDVQRLVAICINDIKETGFANPSCIKNLRKDRDQACMLSLGTAAICHDTRVDQYYKLAEERQSSLLKV